MAFKLPAPPGPSGRKSLSKSRPWHTTAYAMRASLLASAVVALLWPTRPTARRCSRVSSPSLRSFSKAALSADLAPWISGVRRYGSPRLPILPGLRLRPLLDSFGGDAEPGGEGCGGQQADARHSHPLLHGGPLPGLLPQLFPDLGDAGFEGADPVHDRRQRLAQRGRDGQRLVDQPAGTRFITAAGSCGRS